MNLKFKALTGETWKDFEELFGDNGACGGCWCMHWRGSRKEFNKNKGEGNRRAMKNLVDGDRQPGILAYNKGKPIGWCAIAPREDYSALARSRILQPLDDRPCWSISCLFIHKDWRRQGVSSRLIEAATGFASDQGAKLVEAYPVEPREGETIPAAFAWTGIPSAFTRCGFKEEARRSETRPIMRKELN